MTNAEIVTLLSHVAAAYSVMDEKKHYFQIVAYKKASEAIESMSTQLTDQYEEGKLDAVPGIGPSIKKHLTDVFENGKSQHLEKVLATVPSSMFPLLDIPSFGPKKAYRLVTEFHLTNPKTVVQDLQKIAKQGKIAKLDGFGPKSEHDILQAISEYGMGVNKSSRMVLPYASEIADKIVHYMKRCPQAVQVETLGSMRRKKETIGDIDVAVATKDPKKVIDYFVNYPYKDRILEKGDATASILISGGKHIDLMVQPVGSFGSLLQHFTGSKEHNIKLREYALKKDVSLSEYGIKKITEKSKTQKVRESDQTQTYDSEEKFYNALGLDWIPPEIRENTGEIEAALHHTLPKLIELKDIKADFHLHSSFPIEPSHDLGQDTIETMAKYAEKLKYHSIGFSEHNPSQKNHTKEEMKRLVEQRNHVIDQVQKITKSVRIYKLLETDILPSGNLAIDNSVLNILDATIVSVHSVFSMNKNDMTKRVINGLSHKKAKILAHPTGRLIDKRPGYELEWEELFAFCKKHNKALEINAWPYRLDLSDILVKRAISKGVNLVIDTDSHAVSQMNLMRYGVDVARRGWAEKKNIINTWPPEKIRSWLLST